MQALTLFDQPSIFPDGFQYASEFISSTEEEALIQAIGQFTLRPMEFQGYIAKRKTASFGYDYSFTTRQLSKGEAIPALFTGLIDKVSCYFAVNRTDIAELLLTEYPPGSVINWHRDAPPFDQIIGISLGSGGVFKLRPYEKTGRTRKSTISLPISRRSIYNIRGRARSEWEHSIAPVTDMRYSITLRTLKTAS